MTIGAGLAGLGLHMLQLGRMDVDGLGWIARTSYDLPFRVRSSSTRSNAVLIEITENTYGPAGATRVGRARHAAVLNRLKSAGARLILLDVAFTAPAEGGPVDLAQDTALADAMAGCRTNLVFGAIFGAGPTSSVVVPDKAFSNGARWGVLNVDKRPDETVRQLPGLVGHRDASHRSISWVAAELLGAAVTATASPGAERWMGYYGGPGTLFADVVAFEDVEDGSEPIADRFAGKLVFIGETRGLNNEECRNPCGGISPGVEIQATAVFNLLDQEWLTSLNPAAQLALVIGWGALVSTVLGVRPGAGRGIAAVMATGSLVAASWLAQEHLRCWWLWVIPAMVQSPVALVTAGWMRRKRDGSTSIAAGRARVFISYRSDDGEACARTLQQAFAARDITAFLAPGNLTVGEDFPAELLRRIAEARLFVLVLTPGAFASLLAPQSWVARETAQALALGRRMAIVRVGVKPLVAASLPPPLQALADRHSVEFQAGNYFETMMQEMIAGL